MGNKDKALNLVKTLIITLFVFSCMPSSRADEVDTLVQKLKDKYPNVRLKAAEALALGEIKDARVVEPLIAALNDKDPNVRWWAEVALEKIKARMIWR